LRAVRRLGYRLVRIQLRLLDPLLLLSNCVLDVDLQTVHLPLSDIEGLEEDLVGHITPTPIRELHDGDIEGGILREHHLQGVSESRDIVVPRSVQRCVECDGLPVTGREKERRQNHDAVEAEMKSDQGRRGFLMGPTTYHACACIAVDNK